MVFLGGRRFLMSEVPLYWRRGGRSKCVWGPLPSEEAAREGERERERGAFEAERQAIEEAWASHMEVHVGQFLSCQHFLS